MKKIILTALCACACCAYGASAQGFDWGVKAGLNISTVTKVDDSKMKPSVYAGVFAEFTLIDDLLGIQPEVLYSRQGWKMDVADVDIYSRLNYLNIPVIFKLYLIDGLSLDLGPQFGFLLNSQAKAKIDGTKIKADIDGVKNFDVSFDMGLSYRIIQQLDVTARYQLGLTKLTDGGDKPKNSVIQVGLGYRF